MKKINIITTGIISVVIGAISGSIACYYYINQKLIDSERRVNKFKNYYNIANEWLYLKNQRNSITKFFLDNNFKTVAIYGMGELGCRLYEELKESDIKIKYAIDQNFNNSYYDLTIYGVENSYEDVDVLIITPIFDYNNISSEMSVKFKCPIVSLEDVVLESNK